MGGWYPQGGGNHGRAIEGKVPAMSLGSFPREPHLPGTASRLEDRGRPLLLFPLARWGRKPIGHCSAQLKKAGEGMIIRQAHQKALSLPPRMILNKLSVLESWFPSLRNLRKPL